MEAKMFEQQGFWRRKLQKITRFVSADRVALFTGALLMACELAPRAAADVPGGRYHSQAPEQLAFGLSFDEMVGVLLVVASIVFVLYLGKRR
jgi:hypothetical protein